MYQHKTYIAAASSLAGLTGLEVMLQQLTSCFHRLYAVWGHGSEVVCCTICQSSLLSKATRSELEALSGCRCLLQQHLLVAVSGSTRGMLALVNGLRWVEAGWE